MAGTLLKFIVQMWSSTKARKREAAHRRPVLRPLLAWILLSAALAGCVTTPEGEPPRLQIDAGDGEVPMDGTLEVMVRFVNTAEEAFTLRTGSGCLEVQVWVHVDDRSIFLEDQSDSLCTDAVSEVSVAPGEARSWGPFVLRPGEYDTASGPVFKPNTSYTLVADVLGTEASWSVRNETKIRVVEAMGDETLTIEVGPEREAFTAGETVAITARLTNTRDEPFTYTSRDGCNDIHVWAEVGEGDEGMVRLYPDMEGYVCTAALTEFTLAPGETLEWTVHWDGSQSGEGGQPYVRQGSYTLIAKLDGRDELPGGRGDVFVFAPSS